MVDCGDMMQKLSKACTRCRKCLREQFENSDDKKEE